MTVRLRPHHLLCMLTFVGKGYTPRFTENYKQIATRLSAGEDIVIITGPDDICTPMLDQPTAHCHLPGPLDRDNSAAIAAAGILGQPIVAGATIVPDAAMLATMRTAFADGSIRTGCYGCEWSSLCTSVAAGGFEGALVMAAEGAKSN
ncbi:DUF1284 domain-containing protein [Pararhizobium sp.]|uniref:DUF1284 domain-containing protein n=1 Tax=Pararhizobium sp. TaxID=1977563 RepID=UPI00272604DE|nr:DUF1284 domain-containing protein [Pararhizobium sp.]MDO9415786.1 DUF1284 domain-containing protein [Pararhizobium sp.]